MKNFRAADFTELAWTPPSEKRSENQLLIGDLSAIHRRSLYLHRNNSIAAAFSRALIDFVAGTGLTPVGNEKATTIFNAWAKSACISGMQDLDSLYSMIVKQQIEVGDCLVLIVNDSGAVGLQTRLQIVPSTRLCNPDGIAQGGVYKGMTLWHGVCYSPSGREMGYTFKDQEGSDSVRFVPTEDAKTGRPLAILMRRPAALNPMQSRALPIITPIMQEISNIASLWDASLKKAYRDASHSLFLKTDRPADSYAGVGATDANGNAVQDPFDSVNLLADAIPDGILTIPRGADVVQVTPAGNVDLDVLFERSVRFACAATGTPVEVVFKDFSRTNFASGKLSTESFYRYADAWNRGNGFGFGLIYKAVMMEAYLLGMLPIEDAVSPVAWIGSANYSEVDAVKTANAAKTNLEIGLTTLTQELGKKGITLDQHLLARVAEIQKIERIAKAYDIDPKLLMGGLFEAVQDVGSAKPETTEIEDSEEDDAEDKVEETNATSSSQNGEDDE